MVKIELRQTNGKTKEYTQDFVSGRKLRNVVAFGADTEQGKYKTELEQLDAMVALVAGIFDDQEVTADAIYDGVEGKSLADVLANTVEQVMGGIYGTQEGEVVQDEGK